MSEANEVEDLPASRPRLAVSMARRRRSILDAAIDLFHERGYLGTTVDDIAARAGVTKRTLYHHMGSKENILSEIHSGFIDEGLRRWEAVLEKGGTPTEVLSELIAEHLNIVALHRKAISGFFEEAKHLNEANRIEISVQRDRYQHILQSTIARGVETGDFRSDLNVHVVTLLILGGLTEMYRWYIPKSKSAQDSMIALWVSLALDGIAPRS